MDVWYPRSIVDNIIDQGDDFIRNSPIKPIGTKRVDESMGIRNPEECCEVRNEVEPKLHPAKINAWTNHDGSIEIHIIAANAEKLREAADLVTTVFLGY